jgi:hypothetical protein
MISHGWDLLHPICMAYDNQVDPNPYFEIHVHIKGRLYHTPNKTVALGPLIQEVPHIYIYIYTYKSHTSLMAEFLNS